MPEVAAELRAWSGARLLMPRAWYREQGFTDAHLETALARRGSPLTLSRARALLDSESPELPRRARVMDVIDEQRDPVRQMGWRDFVVTSTSQFCAAFFDEGQAALGPDREGGLYESWRRFALADHSPRALMGLRGVRELARSLPRTKEALIAQALADLGVPPDEHEAYFTCLLLDLNGWASWCAYRRWTARHQGLEEDSLQALLAVRLAWEWMLHRLGGPAVARAWQQAMAAWPRIDASCREAQAPDWIFQDALELAYQEQLICQLPRGFTRVRPGEVDVQAVFCIDVRSEVFRRALEAQSPRLQTLGFAGFFGLPIEYQPLGAPAGTPQLPGLLAPKLRVQEAASSPSALADRLGRLQARSALGDFKGSPVSTFTFVEALGPGFLVALARDSLGLGAPTRPSPHRPWLLSTVAGEALSVEARVELAAGVLRAMSLTHDFAPLVALIGHGSQTRNNPHAAGLDCGACCGQTGEVNARAAAALLNSPEVRAGLGTRGITVPKATHFLAGLHDTTTDEVTLFDLEHVPLTQAEAVSALQAQLERASHLAREERAQRLGLTGAKGGLLASVRRRARDWAQVRPEWGLANNAAFVIAPRERCQHLDLGGRSFLHEYRHEEDPSGAVLELLMTAPMVVTHWINLQYYASTVDNDRYGSGNKVLHNVVGGHLGVFAGNGGDLRIGLSTQSLHDGSRWMHEPLRLNVFIDAPREAIDRVLERHPKVRGLVENEWLHLFQLDSAEGAVREWDHGKWTRR